MTTSEQLKSEARALNELTFLAIAAAATLVLASLPLPDPRTEAGSSAVVDRIEASSPEPRSAIDPVSELRSPELIRTMENLLNSELSRDLGLPTYRIHLSPPPRPVKLTRR